MITPSRVNEPNLIDLLSEETETKGEAAKAQINESDFTSENIPDDSQEDSQDDSQYKNLDEINKSDIDEIDSSLTNQELSDFYIDFFDIIQSMILPSLMSSRIFSKSERIKMIEWKKTKPIIENLSSDDKNLIDKIKNFENYKKDLPFDEKEKTTLSKPLAKLLEKRNVKMSPESALLQAAIFVMLPRLAPIYNNEFDSMF